MMVEQLLAGLQLVEHELLLFAAFWFIVGAVDELVVDISWLWLRLTGRIRVPTIGKHVETAALDGKAALFVPAWREAEVIESMVAYTLKAWPQAELMVYVGCYCNDAATIAAAMKGAGVDTRVRLVVLDREGPTTKADCLNRLYSALETDERRRGFRFDHIVLHDAEDMVHPAALSVIDTALADVDFVQLPVAPEPQVGSRWIAGHYSDEFAEAHGKTLVVRDALGAAIPAAGVGCGFSRETIGLLAQERSRNGATGPFAAECLTEDYELGLLVSHGGSGGRFLRLRDRFGEIVATRAFFPNKLDESVRQKTRWIHGIALQGWDRLGWTGGPIDLWMSLRDRRGPLTALVLGVAYGLVVIEALLAGARLAGWDGAYAMSGVLKSMLVISFAAFAWRALWRFGFTAHTYGLAEGLRGVLRIPIANIIAIMSGRRALFAYVKTLLGGEVSWDKTQHRMHPANLQSAARSR